MPTKGEEAWYPRPHSAGTARRGVDLTFKIAGYVLWPRPVCCKIESGDAAVAAAISAAIRRSQSCK